MLPTGNLWNVVWQAAAWFVVFVSLGLAALGYAQFRCKRKKWSRCRRGLTLLAGCMPLLLLIGDTAGRGLYDDYIVKQAWLIKEGATYDEVLSRLGEPDDVRTDVTGEYVSQSWAYYYASARSFFAYSPFFPFIRINPLWFRERMDEKLTGFPPPTLVYVYHVGASIREYPQRYKGYEGIYVNFESRAWFKRMKKEDVLLRHRCGRSDMKGEVK